MRLLHTGTLKLHEFVGDDVPQYAILSHTWAEQEMSYQEIITEIRPSGEASFDKIAASCKQANEDGWKYIWIDTCCIDKTSSAELSEAINSMCRWYRQAEICYAYLIDVDIRPSLPDVEDSNQLESFRRSRWFTRGWTLQELLAPRNVVFFNRGWEVIGDKWTLRREISSATNIQSGYIRFPEKASVAAKMSWASKRKTTRTEDLAYCLMGLFDVNMPLLYGEGQKAFIRLQHEILKANPDESLFAWRDSSLSESGLFAQTPAAFAESGNIIPSHIPMRLREKDEPMSVTNRGLTTRARLWLPDQGSDYFDVKDGQKLLQTLSVFSGRDKCLLLSCTLNHKSDLAISVLVNQQSPNRLSRINLRRLIIHNLDHAFDRRCNEIGMMFVDCTTPPHLPGASSRAKLPWIRVRRAPFGRNFSLLQSDRFEDATVIRASSEVESKPKAWDTVIESPWIGELWFCTEDNDLFVIKSSTRFYDDFEVFAYQGIYRSNQSYKSPAASSPNDGHWKSLPETTRTYGRLFGHSTGQLPSSSYVSIKHIFDFGFENRKNIDIVVDKQPFFFIPKNPAEDVPGEFLPRSKLQRLKPSHCVASRDNFSDPYQDKYGGLTTWGHLIWTGR